MKQSDDRKWRFQMLRIGNRLLLLFLLGAIAAAVYLLPKFAQAWKGMAPWPVTPLLIVLSVELIFFWTGIIIVYLSSVQLGFKTRIWGILLGMIPIAHLVMFWKILTITGRECKTELAKVKVNEKRAKEMICRTRYPLLLVHGVFFRDTDHFNYWGRIPEELEMNGATIFYGEHQSAASVDDSAKELEARILQIIAEGPYEKVNVIAHSKGGLDMRTALAKTSIAPYVASLTTINTPHRGCAFADYLLEKIPPVQQRVIEQTYNAAAKQFGDPAPDFMAAVKDLTASACSKRNEVVKDVPGVFVQSVGSVLNRPGAGQFPLNMTSRFVHLFDGKNDGLVGEASFPWGERFQMLAVAGKRGISHGDVIDLNRENFDGFDVREFFVQLVADLKARGL